ncbi:MULTISPECIES: GAF domain-containing sensor histidine kinase [unclassified Planococcus (in: firmicutes)]|uniref:GAF domain-containing sensor histidine kinase n=1 Tax=unclassified Planococcus (in: firmicutes) TaxID=2662419 RepID=UPI001F15CB3D|nr:MULTISPECIES: GAF domain-containing sensor histidine kinase [unclassified Planococcus (in: firmicutes)]UJF27843.1 GAF domain-containing sensor histidine kinase [Planococcus sp. 107-1]GKW47739.1 sensor histidine kinase [Planococcus sp. NCCP-2050]
MVMDEHSNVTLLKEIAELLNEETDMKRMLDGAVWKLLNGSNFESAWIFFINEKGKHQLVTHANLPPALQRNECRHLQKGGCWCVKRYHDGDLEKASNIIACQRIENSIAANAVDHGGITHHATVPLQSGEEKFGLLNIAAPDTVRFSKDELALLESVAFQIGSAIKRIGLTKQEQEMALVKERNRLARDLHDSVNQLLFSVTLTARGGIEMSEEENVQGTFRDIQHLTQEALNEMRALIWQLRPKGLESGLLEAIQAYGEMLGLTLEMKVTGVIQLPSRTEETLFRIAQEALNNIRKHSGINNAQLFLTVTSSDVLMVIKDEGRGFIVDERLQLPSIGVQSMRDRAKAEGGTVDWSSEIGKGTEILVRIPY